MHDYTAKQIWDSPGHVKIELGALQGSPYEASNKAAVKNSLNHDI